jgi:hypothetical protein
LDRRWWLRLILCSHALEFFGEGFCYTYVGHVAAVLEYPFPGCMYHGQKCHIM